ncbi:uncharacterized protein DNG_10450 [Cephalotrichum gorgonifer]|uniref:Arylsulfotransferase n=1 Tax=Cephalotrichum gorgonifer TaxID=2041049 RepID=A0AAE8T0A3_9PEZI|nr:uncharacterized protein DNG_10450 [Cephalotrichum gorgonifer]
MKSQFFQLFWSAILAGKARADLPFYTNATAYNSGAYGNFPNQTFHSSDIVAPRFLVNKFEPDAIDKAPYLFFEWLYDGVGSPMIFRSDDLSLVYADPSYPGSGDVQIQTVFGEDYLTFWGGEEGFGQGNGHCYIFDQNYDLVHVIMPIGVAPGRFADLHECLLTSEGNVLVIVYESAVFDLTSVGGPVDGLCWDQLFQEIDPKTGQLLFSWRASEHYAISDTNRVYPDDHGDDYLISARSLDSIILINGTDGGTLWTLGGKNNDFTDTSGGRALGFAEQHHARIRGQNRMTLFDNHNRKNGVGCVTGCSRGLELKLDLDAMTAKFVREYYHPTGLVAAGKGGYVPLENGNALIAWGSQPSITEHKGDQVVMEIQVGRLSDELLFETNWPYRAFRMDWAGKPAWGPSIAVDSSAVYLSWNGATELDSWAVLASEKPQDILLQWETLAESKREGFETTIPLEGPKPHYIRGLALGNNGKVLGCTPVVDLQTGSYISTDDNILCSNSLKESI